jgi:U3 small nucleolar RNA-associated protein 14
LFLPTVSIIPPKLILIQGTWGGAGTRLQTPKPHLVKKIAGVDPKSRADFKKAHVIISEKRDKKAAKYLVKDLPFPYTSQAQFERSLERPLGTEWNTRLAFQRGTLPRVVKKANFLSFAFGYLRLTLFV